MKTLYFDIDGTILSSDQHDAKPCLANGRLEAERSELVNEAETASGPTRG
jgi:hypothetical protein